MAEWLLLVKARADVCGLQPGVPEVVTGGLAAIPAALERLKAGEVSGRKLVVRPHEET